MTITQNIGPQYIFLPAPNTDLPRIKSRTVGNARRVDKNSYKIGTNRHSPIIFSRQYGNPDTGAAEREEKNDGIRNLGAAEGLNRSETVTPRPMYKPAELQQGAAGELPRSETFPSAPRKYAAGATPFGATGRLISTVAIPRAAMGGDHFGDII